MFAIKKKGQDARNNPQEEIATIMHKVGNALSAYKQQVVIGASILAVLLVLVAGYRLLRSSDERKSGPPLLAALVTFTTSAESAPDYGKALEMFRAVQKQYSGTTNAAIAQYYIGNCLANMGQTDEALKEYQVFINTYSGDKFVLGLVYQRMGYIYGMLGKQEDAIKAFEQADALIGPGVATVELARLYEASGNAPESQKKYKVIQEKLGGTNWGIEAMGKVQTIRPAEQPAAGSEGK